MSKLKSILEEALADSTLLGGESSIETQLEAHRKELLKSMWIWFSVLILLILLGVLGLTKYLDCNNATIAKQILGALGLSGASGGVVNILRKVWLQWSSTSLVFILLTDSTKAQKNDILRKLVNKLD